jgi:hypothetical protein
MAVLTVNWETTTRVSPADDKVVTGESTPVEATTPEPLRHADRPLLVYVVPSATAESFDKVEKVILADDKVAIGSWAFKRMKITPEDAENDPLFKGKGHDVPRFLIVSPDYKDVEVIEGSKLSVSGVWNAMKSGAKKYLKGNFDKDVREMRDVMNEWDKISKERSVLEEKEKRETNPTPADRKDIEGKKAELDARQKAADEKKAQLMKFELKVAA